MKKNISLSLDEILGIISCIDTSIIYLENCKSRFKLLKMPFYFKEIDVGINRYMILRNRFFNLYSKFDTSDISIKNNDIFSTFIKLSDNFLEGS